MGAIPVKLATFDNAWYSPGRSRIVQALWFFLGAPIVSSRVLPFSSVRATILRLFGAKVGSGVVFKPGLKIKYPWRLEIGNDSWIGEDAWLDNLDQITIGGNVCVSQGAYLCTGNHDWADGSFGLIVKPIRVCDGAWVGAKCFIGPGVEIGECAVVAAGSVAARHIPAYEIHGGNPAKFIRTREVHTHADRSPVRSGI